MLPADDTTPTRLNSPVFLLVLNVAKSGPTKVRSLELLCDGHRTRNSFTADKDLSDVLAPVFCYQVRKLLGTLVLIDGIINCGEQCMKSGDLTLSKIRIISGYEKDGVRQVTIRFGTILGNINEAFNQNIFHVDSFLAQSSSAAINVAEAIVMRVSAIVDGLEDIVARSEQGSLHDAKRCIASVRTSMEELDFFNLLLLRQTGQTDQVATATYIPAIFEDGVSDPVKASPLASIETKSALIRDLTI